ncbi:MAG: hypothetical protein ACFFCQ_10715 [Promethearchaeota archaeon]
MVCTLVIPLRQIKPPKRYIEEYGFIFPSSSFYFPRYITNVKIIEPRGDLPLIRAVVDTGASISVLNVPQLAALAPDTLPIPLYGIHPDPESRVNADLFPVTLQIQDEMGNQTPPLRASVAVTDNTGLPNILGMLDLLERFEIRTDPVQKTLLLTLKQDTSNI